MQPTHPTPIDSSAPLFDKRSFVKYMKDIGREYREQARKLLSICRIFAEAQEQTPSSYDDFRSVLQVVDDALYSVTEARKKTTKDADAKIEKATNALSTYEKKYHPTSNPSRETVTQTMAEAEAKDNKSSKILNRLKETFRPPKEEPMTEVEFHLQKSLLDKNPTIVKQMIGQTSNTKEILWNFSRFKDGKRLTLKDNPHFYEKLPASAEEYKGYFQTCPIETFYNDKISVLTDDPRLTGRVFLETSKGKRAFGNVWVPKEAIIFKDINGKLEGENIVGNGIQKTPNLWCFEEPPPSNASCSSLYNSSSPSPTVSGSPTASPTGSLIDDWREPILRLLRSQDIDIRIRISDKPPTNASLSYLPPSSPIPLSAPGISNESLLSPKVTQLQRHINPITPLGSTRAPGAPAPSSPTSPSLLPSRPTSAPLSNIAPPVSVLPLPPPKSAPAPLTACPTSLQEESRGGSAHLECTISLPVPTNVGAPPSGLRVSITSPLQISTTKPPTATHMAEVATVVPPPLGSPPLPVKAQSGAPTPQAPAPQAQMRKKSWFQNAFGVLKNNLSMQAVRASEQIAVITDLLH